MDILRQIQADLINQDVPLSITLRKAKVLASQLRSSELSNWVSQELDGYKSGEDLPDYRILNTACVGSWTNGYWMASNHQVPLRKIEHERLKELLTTFHVYDGIRTIEEYATNQELKFFLDADMTTLVNHYVREGGYGYAQIQYAIGNHEFEQILDTVKNRLLDFVLKLDENWQVDTKPPSKDELSQLMSVIIYNNAQGGNMSIFDQRGQQVNYQYNAAGNINIQAVQDKDQLVAELEKLIAEIGRAKDLQAVNHEVAIEAEYHLLQANKEAKKQKPNKSSFLEHIGKAKGLLEDVAAATGLVTALLQASEIARKIFHW